MNSVMKEKGFTLVELAIALMIIALLIGGVLKGQELIENARVTTMLRQMKSYDTAIAAFRATYGAIPGDMVNAGARVPNCTTTTYCTGKGDGDGYIDYTTWSASPKETNNWANDEGIAMFQQLARTGLITGVSTDEVAPNTIPGGTLPSSPFKTLPYVQTWDEADGRNVYIWFRKPTGLSGSPNGGGNTTAFKPRQVFQMDTKIDNGFANSGDIQAWTDNSFGHCTVSTDPTAYMVNDYGEFCNLFYKLHY